MTNYFKRLISVTVGIFILIGFPYLLGSWIWLIISWFPALVVVIYLDNE